MKAAATGLLVVMAAVFIVARQFEAAYPVARLGQGVRRGGDGRRAGRLVRGHRSVPPPARPADPAHRDHPAQQGPHRRGAGQFPQGEFPDRAGRRAAHAQHRPRRRGRPLPPGAAGRGDAHPPGRQPADRRLVRKPRRRAARRARQGRDLQPPAQDGGRRRCSAMRWPARSTRTATCRCSRRRSAGPRARSTPTRA